MTVHSFFAAFSVLFYGFSFTSASPLLQSRASVTAMTTDQISVFRPYTHYASTGYCQPASTLAWDCAVCNTNPSFKPVASGGDGDDVQYWFVGYDPVLQSVIVTHQGTNFAEIDAVLTDADLLLEELDSSLFPGISSSVKAHSGFAKEHAKTASQILSAVQNTTATFGATEVSLVGHSLGAALALLDSVYLPLHLPGIKVKTVGYGMPRVGNQAFADYVDAHVTDLHRINNKADLVPILPGEFMGYHHPSGEIHITESNFWEACSGQDNPSSKCSTGQVWNIFEGDSSDHDGPYDGITMMGC